MSSVSFVAGIPNVSQSARPSLAARKSMHITDPNFALDRRATHYWDRPPASWGYGAGAELNVKVTYNQPSEATPANYTLGTARGSIFNVSPSPGMYSPPAPSAGTFSPPAAGYPAMQRQGSNVTLAPPQQIAYSPPAPAISQQRTYSPPPRTFSPPPTRTFSPPPARPMLPQPPSYIAAPPPVAMGAFPYFQQAPILSGELESEPDTESEAPTAKVSKAPAKKKTAAKAGKTAKKGSNCCSCR